MGAVKAIGRVRAIAGDTGFGPLRIVVGYQRPTMNWPSDEDLYDCYYLSELSFEIDVVCRPTVRGRYVILLAKLGGSFNICELYVFPVLNGN